MLTMRRRIMARRGLLAVLSALGLLLPLLPTSTLHAQRGAFVVMLGTDTLAVEQYARSGNRVEGDFVQRQPTTSIWHYVVALNPDGTAQRAEYTMRRSDGSLMPNGVKNITMLFGPDTVTT